MCARTSAEYEELRRTKEEKKRQLPDIVFKQPRVLLHRSDVNDVRVHPEPQKPEPPHIIEEEELEAPYAKDKEEPETAPTLRKRRSKSRTR